MEPTKFKYVVFQSYSQSWIQQNKKLLIGLSAGVILTILIVIAIASSGSVDVVDPCCKSVHKGDWEALESKFYLLRKEAVKQSEAQSFCSQAGGKLWEPKDHKTNFAVVNRFVELYRDPYDTIWTGINDFDSEGKFKYLSDPQTSVDYTNWAPGEPNDGENGEHCVEVTIRLTSPTSGLATRGEWNDKGCNDLRGFVCEKDSACICKPEEN